MTVRWINGLLFVVLASFTGVQYNDPDFYFWGAVYGCGAAWCAVAAFSPALLRHLVVRVLLALCVVLAIVGTVHYWPTEAGFWQREVWWESERAREGMGMMILTVFLLFPVIAAAARRRVG